MSAFSEAELEHLDPEKADRLRRMFDYTPPLEPLEIGEWPYEHVPGEFRSIVDEPPVALENAPPPAPGEEGSP